MVILIILESNYILMGQSANYDFWIHDGNRGLLMIFDYVPNSTYFDAKFLKVKAYLAFCE